MGTDEGPFGDALAETGLLAGLDDSARAERVELIAWLLEEGFSFEQIKAEVAPMLLGAHRALGNDGRYVSDTEVSRRHGIDVELLASLERALGLPKVDDPDAEVRLRADAEAAARLQHLVEAGLDPGQVVLLVRRLAEGISNAVPAFRYSTISAILKPGFTELQVAKAHEEIVQRVVPLLGPMIRDILFVQLRRALEGEVVTASERASGTALPGARRLTVAFADMVGFTKLGEAVPPEELVGLVEELAELAHDVVHPPVRLVKTIGDAVMLVSTDPVKLLDATLELLDATDRAAALPQLRIGVATGWAVSRARDWFGSPVNVASRVTSAAEPGMVVVEGTTRDTIGDAVGYRWSFIGARQLKGVDGETQLFAVRRDG